MTLTFCLYVYILKFLHVDISILKLWHLTLTLTLYYSTACLNITVGFCGYLQSKKNQRIPRLSIMDSVVIYPGFCGYLSWILWLSGTNIGYRDASTSKKTIVILSVWKKIFWLVYINVFTTSSTIRTFYMHYCFCNCSIIFWTLLPSFFNDDLLHIPPRCCYPKTVWKFGGPPKILS